MDSLFAKIIFFSSFLLASITGPNYIKIAQNDLTFNFKTGEIFPIYYYLNIQNVGPQKARFEISSDVQWISVYREGQDIAFLELSPQAYINFILEIHPERLPDGVNKAKVFIRVLDIALLVNQELVLDEAEVSITLNKNFASTTTPKVSPEISPEISPALTATSEPTAVSPAPTSTLTPSFLIKTPTPQTSEVRIPTPSVVGASPKTSPVEVLSIAPIPSSRLESTLKQIQSLIDSIRLFLKNIF